MIIEKVTIQGGNEILYLAQLIERDIVQLEANLKQRQEFLKKFKDKPKT